MKKLSDIQAPALAGVIRQSRTSAVIAQLKNCALHGADMIDLHLSCLEDTSEQTLRRIFTAATLPVLALNYNAKVDWSPKGYSEEERVDLLLRALQAGADGVDIQGYTFDEKSKNGFFGEDGYSFTKGEPKEIVTDKRVIEKQKELIERVHGMGKEVLLSCHPGVVMNTQQVVELALFLEKRNPDIVKIVTVANTEEDVAEGVRTMLALKKEVKTKVSYHLNGKAGALSRIFNPLLGGQIAFCVDGYDEWSTMEQIDLATARRVVDGIKKLK